MPFTNDAQGNQTFVQDPYGGDFRPATEGLQGYSENLAKYWPAIQKDFGSNPAELSRRIGAAGSLDPQQTEAFLVGKGIDPGFAAQVRAAGEASVAASKKEGSFGNTLRDFASGVLLNPVTLAALGGAGGAALAGGGATAGGAVGAAGGDISALTAAGMMPSAVPLTSETLGAMGLSEIAPGVWAAGGAGAALGVPTLEGAGAATAATGGTTAPSGVAPEALGTGLKTTPGLAGDVPGSAIGQAAPSAGLNQGAAAVGAAAPTATAPAAAGVTGIAAVDDALSWMKKNAVGLTGLGIGAAGSLRKPPQIPNEQTITALGTEGAAAAHQLIGQYQSGQLSSGQQASLDQLTQQTKTRISQYFASIGQSDSTAAVQAMAQVDQQAATMKQQMLDNALQQGLQAIGVAQGPLNTVANYQLGQDKALRDAFGNFAGQLGTFAGRSAGSVQTPTNTTAAPLISSATG